MQLSDVEDAFASSVKTWESLRNSLSFADPLAALVILELTTEAAELMKRIEALKNALERGRKA